MSNSDSAIVRAESIYKRFGEKEILRGVSMSVRKGDLKVIIGPSGAGKSTLLQVLNLLVPPTAGQVFLDNEPIDPNNRKALNRLRQEVGMIFQDFNLFDHLNAVNNVSIALRKVKGMSRAEAHEKAMAELERVGLSDRALLYPAELSGGQKQRVAIARTLAMAPKVMLLDEPTSALDPELVGEVVAVIQDLSRSGMTMVMATHQMDFARALATEILFMERGEIVEQGRPADLLAPDAGSRTRDFCMSILNLTLDAGEV